MCIFQTSFELVKVGNTCAQKIQYDISQKKWQNYNIIGYCTLYTPKNLEKWRITNFSLCATEDARQSMPRPQNKSCPPPPPTLAAKEERSKEQVTFEIGTI